MAAPPLFLLLSLSAAIVSRPAAASFSCASQKFTENRVFERCVDLPQHKAYLHWTHDAANSSLSVGFVAAPTNAGGWVAWAINPSGTGMIGSQALIAFEGEGSAMTVKTYNVQSYARIEESKLSIEVWDMAAESVDGSMRIFAKVKLPEKKATVNQVWQVGRAVAGGGPVIHGMEQANRNSKGTLDLAAGQATNSGGDGDSKGTLAVGKATSGGGDGGSKVKLRNIHGILNALSWGIMFPLGVIIARYMKAFPSADPLWFYLHVSCQATAYALGTAGWGSGMKLRSESKGIVYSLHGNIGIALFFLASLQVTALLYRPRKGDKNRVYWEIYHHTAGFAIAVLGIFNVIKGIDILNPAQKWQTGYYSVLTVLVVAAVLLEVVTRTVVSKRDSENGSIKTP